MSRLAYQLLALVLIGIGLRVAAWIVAPAIYLLATLAILAFIVASIFGRVPRR